jgi:hypothetical protein
MSPVDEELERRVSDRLAGLDTMTFQRRTAPTPPRRRDTGPLLVVVGCLAAIATAVVLVTSRNTPAPAGHITTTPNPATPAPKGDPTDRLPTLQPGQLHGVARATAGGCLVGTVDLAHVEQATTTVGACARPGAALGLELDFPPDARTFQVVDLTGRPVRTLTAPPGATMLDWTSEGVVFCDRVTPALTPAPGSHGVLRRFDGGSDLQLPACPFTRDVDGGVQLYASNGGRDVVDQAGRLLAHGSKPFASDTRMLIISDHLFAAGRDLYRDGRLVGSFGEPDWHIVSASADGRVVLVSDNTTVFDQHFWIYRDGRRHAIDSTLATTGGAVAPDGRHVLVQHEPQVLLELDTATLRPLARLDLETEFVQWSVMPGVVWSWR